MPVIVIVLIQANRVLSEMQLYKQLYDLYSCLFDHNMEIIRNNKGGDKLCLNGYMYVKKATKKNRVRWQCSMRDSKACKGAATTSLEVRIWIILLVCKNAEQAQMTARCALHVQLFCKQVMYIVL